MRPAASERARKHVFIGSIPPDPGRGTKLPLGSCSGTRHPTIPRSLSWKMTSKVALCASSSGLSYRVQQCSLVPLYGQQDEFVPQVSTCRRSQLHEGRHTQEPGAGVPCGMPKTDGIWADSSTAARAKRRMVNAGMVRDKILGSRRSCRRAPGRCDRRHAMDLDRCIVGLVCAGSPSRHRGSMPARSLEAGWVCPGRLEGQLRSGSGVAQIRSVPLGVELYQPTKLCEFFF